MDDFRFHVLFNSVLVISGQWEADNERLCAMELCLQLTRFEKISPRAGIELDV